MATDRAGSSIQNALGRPIVLAHVRCRATERHSLSPRPRPMTAEQLSELRAMADLSLEEFARRLGVEPTELEEMETGRREIPARFEEEAFIVADRAIRDAGWP